MTTRKKKNSRKSLAIALGIVGVAGLSMASAAQLSVTSNDVSAGTADVVSCDTDGVTVSYTTAFAATQYEVSDIDVTGVAAACVGDTISITVRNSGGTTIFTGSQVVSGTTESFGSVDVAAEDVEDVDVAIFQ